MKNPRMCRGFFLPLFRFFSERCLSKQGFYFFADFKRRIQPFHGAGLLSVISVDVDRKAAFVKRLNKALMFRRQPVLPRKTSTGLPEPQASQAMDTESPVTMMRSAQA